MENAENKITPTSETQQSSNQEKRLFLIDGYGFVFRAYHALPPLTNPEGVPVGAVHGFANMLFKLKNRVEAHKDDSYIAVIFDAGKNTFRNDIYADYKANRVAPPDDLIPQFALVRDTAVAMNLEVVEKVGYEADDIIATYTKQATEQGFKVTIVSGDKDLMQLINDDVEMLDTLRDRIISYKEVHEKFGVTPDKVLDVLSLMGDSSDNIPGVPSIGPKTAAELINQFGSLDAVLERAEEITQKKRREVIIEHKQQALISRQLATLCYDVELEKKVEDFKIKQENPEQIFEFLQKHNFKSLYTKMKEKLSGGGVNVQVPEFKVVTTAKPAGQTSLLGGIGAPQQVSESHITFTQNDLSPEKLIVTEIKDAGSLEAFLPEILKTKSLGVHFCYDDKRAIKTLVIVKETSGKRETGIINFDTSENEGSFRVSQNQDDLFSQPVQKADDKIEYFNLLKPYFTEPSIKIRGNNLKDTIVNLQKYKLDFVSFDDVEIMAYLLGKSKEKQKIENLAEEFLGVAIAADNQVHKAVLINELAEILYRDIYNYKLAYIYDGLEKPLVKNISDIEIAGIKIDKDELAKLSTQFKNSIKELEEEIFAAAGVEFNVGSPKQLGEILFEKMGIPGGKKSKAGGYGTGADVLEDLSYNGHVIADKVLEWRKFSKLVSTYTDALQNYITPETGRVHTRFSTNTTTTGRLSSLEPNLQNIPIRNEEGRQIRAAFIAEKGNKLIDVDFSQIELRLLAVMANIPVLQKAFREGKDIHLATAMEVFGLTEAQVTPEIRRNAKTINFGIIYGQSAFGLAQQLGISRVKAKEYIEAYFTKYPGILNFMEETKEFARAHGYVTTIFGRRIYLNGIKDKNPMMRANAERAAINAPLQGTAADLIKKAMLAVDAGFKEKGMKAKIVLQVHDELIIEAPEAEAELAKEIAIRKMEQTANLSVPLTTDAKIGQNWGEVH